ncbi:caspase family protein, partial [Clostridioides difficile]|nr:caspase family protein [Clostridioides difficile]
INLRMSILNKNYINCKQNPIFRSNILGDIYFNVKDYKSYIKKKVFQEHDDYIIYNVKSLHISIIKRYSVEVILKNKFSYCDISEISKEVFDIVKSVEVYNSEIGEDRLKGKDANIIWVYFGKDEIDMINGIYMCKTTWIDKYQEKDIWYSVNGKNKFFINGVHTETYDNYESLKSYISQNTITKEKAVYEVKE